MLEEIKTDGTENGQTSANKMNATIVEVNALSEGTRPHLMKVINKTGGSLARGFGYVHDGVDTITRLPKIKAGIATDYNNARLLGVLQGDLLDDEQGYLIRFGTIEDIDTSHLDIDIPIFLSDTASGAFVSVAPDIATQVGGVLIKDAVLGSMFIDLINNQNLPATLGYIQGQLSPAYSLSAVATAIVNYSTERGIVTSVDKLAGTIAPLYTGVYRATLSMAFSFVSSTQTRSITAKLYDVTLGAYVAGATGSLSIPKDSTSESGSSVMLFDAIINHEYIVHLTSATAIDITVDSVSLDIKSEHIR